LVHLEGGHQGEIFIGSIKETTCYLR